MRHGALVGPSFATALSLPCACGDAGGETCDPAQDGSAPYVDAVTRFEPAPDATFNHDLMPDVVLGPPGGGMDVVALGCGGSIELSFDPAIVDGPGPDFIVFENPFPIGGSETTFAEPAVVAVGDDGTRWHELECSVSGDESWPPTGCAGWNPFVVDTEDPTDPAEAGGDAFDLADFGVDEATFVRLVDVTAEYYGHMDWCDGGAGGFDLDAVAVVHGGCE